MTKTVILEKDNKIPIFNQTCLNHISIILNLKTYKML